MLMRTVTGSHKWLSPSVEAGQGYPTLLAMWGKVGDVTEKTKKARETAHSSNMMGSEGKIFS